MRRFILVLVFGMTIMVQHRAVGQIIGTTGAVTFIAQPPEDVSANNWESNTQIRAFNEVQNLLLSQAISADITLPGTSPGPVDSNLSTATIPAGTRVNSYMLHYDVNGTRPADNALEAIGTITFATDILGLEVLSATENSTNAVLGYPGETYSAGNDHGLELSPGGGGTSDSITLSGDRRTVSVDLLNASFADDVRIVTAVPEPSVIALMGVGLSALLLCRHFRLFSSVDQP